VKQSKKGERMLLEHVVQEMKQRSKSKDLFLADLNAQALRKEASVLVSITSSSSSLFSSSRKPRGMVVVCK
jgi:hypothetical protein